MNQIRRFRRVLCIVLTLSLLFGSFAPMTASAASKKPYLIKVNRSQNCITVYEKDTNGEYTVPVKAFVCSVGLNNATPLGTFSIKTKYRWHELFGEVYGQYCSRIAEHILFHSVYYSKPDPSTLYYKEYNKLGSAASHGCIRLSVADAKWIYNNCASGTKVIIYDSKKAGPLGKPKAFYIDPKSKNRGWDPTDSDKKNPWHKTLPTLSGVKNKTLERRCSSSKLLSGVTGKDYLGNKLKVTVSGNYDLKKSGSYKVTYKVTDSYGNQVKKSATITVKDTTKPIVTLLDNDIILEDSAVSFESIDDLKSYLLQFVSAKDSGVTLAKKRISIDCDELFAAMCARQSGSYSVYVTAKDVAGNVSKKKTLYVSYYADIIEPDPEQPTAPIEPTDPVEP